MTHDIARGREGGETQIPPVRAAGCGWETFALTKYGSQKKVKDMGELVKMAEAKHIIGGAIYEVMQVVPGRAFK